MVRPNLQAAVPRFQHQSNVRTGLLSEENDPGKSESNVASLRTGMEGYKEGSGEICRDRKRPCAVLGCRPSKGQEVSFHR